jgi:hypothetical protein
MTLRTLRTLHLVCRGFSAIALSFSLSVQFLLSAGKLTWTKLPIAGMLSEVLVLICFLAPKIKHDRSLRPEQENKFRRRWGG